MLRRQGHSGRAIGAACTRTAFAMLMAAAGAAGAAAEEGQPPSPPAESIPVGFTLGYVASIPGDAWSILSAPVRWSTDDWLLAGAVGAIGIILYGFDTRIRGLVQDHRSTTADRWAGAIRPFGQHYIAIPLAGTAAGSLISDDPRLVRTALLGTESLALSLAGYGALQLLTNRARPSSEGGKAQWSGPELTRNHSFPSGEATAAFSCATIIADEWHGIPGVAPVSYGIATLVAVERLYFNAHWATDLFAAGVLGYAVSQGVEQLHPLTTSHLGTISIVPVLTARERLLSITWSY